MKMLLAIFTLTLIAFNPAVETAESYQLDHHLEHQKASEHTAHNQVEHQHHENQLPCDDCHEKNCDESDSCCLNTCAHVPVFISLVRPGHLRRTKVATIKVNWYHFVDYHPPYLDTLSKPPLHS